MGFTFLLAQIVPNLLILILSIISAYHKPGQEIGLCAAHVICQKNVTVWVNYLHANAGERMVTA